MYTQTSRGRANARRRQWVLPLALVAVTVGILVVVGVSLANQAGRATLSLQVGECFDAPTLL